MDGKLSILSTSYWTDWNYYLFVKTEMYVFCILNVFIQNRKTASKLAFFKQEYPRLVAKSAVRNE